MLLTEELALVALDPRSGRHRLGTRSELNACLAALLIAELVLAADVVPGVDGRSIRSEPPRSARPIGSAMAPALAAAAGVVDEKGPKMKVVLSAMDRGLSKRLGTGTWETAMAGLAAAGAVGPATGRWRRRDVLDNTGRDEIVRRLQRAAAGGEELDARTALVLSMTGPARLLEVVAPARSGRKHARRRIDHTLDSTHLAGVGDVVRKVLAEAAAAAGAGAVAGAVVASGSC